MKRKIAKFFSVRGGFVASLPVLLVTVFQCFAAAGVADGKAEICTTQIVIGLAVQLVISAIAVAYSVALLGTGWRRFLFGERLSPRIAIARGLKYGVLAVFMVLGFAAVQEAGLKWLGISCGEQPIFALFSDPTVPKPLKIIMAMDGVLIAPIIEELMFRGVLLRCWSGYGKRFVWPLTASALYFAVVHLHWPAVLPLTLFAVMLGMAWRSTQSLVAPIVMHMVFNLSSLIVFLASVFFGAS